MTIYFLRHAEAEDLAESDFDRKLTPKGLQQAAKVGKFCASHGLEPTVILCSPVTRAKQTAEIVAGAFGRDVSIESWLACGMETSTLLERLAPHAGSDSVLIVGHEPDFSTAIGDLLGNTEPSAILVKKASLTAVEAPWLEPGAGQLEFSIPCRLMSSSSPR
jgi:phosphohistidine phosphatase